MTKEIKITSELFMQLCRYFLADLHDEELYNSIAESINEKLKKLVAHEEYSQKKQTP